MVTDMRQFKINFYVPLCSQLDYDLASDIVERLSGEGRTESLNRDQFTDEVREFLLQCPHILLVDGEVWHSVDLTSTDRYNLVVDFKEFHLSDYGLECLADNQHEIEYRDGMAELFRTCDDITISLERLH